MIRVGAFAPSLLITLVLATIVMTAPAAAESVAPSGEVDPIVIAVEAPLTGPQSANGNDILRGAKLAVGQVNARGGVLGRQVTIAGLDDRADVAYAESSVTKAKEAGAVAVIGPYNSSVGQVNLGLYMDAKIVPLRMTSANQTKGLGATTQAMVWQTSPVEVPYLASIASKRVTMLVDPSAYTKTVADSTAEGLQKRGIDVVKISIDAQASDYTDSVQQALASNPDVIYSSTYYPAGAKIAIALYQANQSLPTSKQADCFMNLANVDNAFVTETGVEVARSCHFSGVPAAQQFPGAEQYVADYIAAYGKAPDVWGSFAYDSALVLFDAMERAGTTNYAKLLSSVLATEGLNGVTGTININPDSGDRRLAPMFILAVDKSGDFIVSP